MEKEKIRALLKRYFEGDTSIEEERVLKTYFKGDTIDAEFLEHQSLFTFLKDTKKQKTEAEANTLFKKIPPSKGIVITIEKHWFLRIAAGIALLVVGFVAGKWQGNNDVGHDQEGLVTLQNDIKALKTMLTLANMQQSTASERIRTVNQSFTISEANQDIIVALLLTLNSDANVNVRLAACEALYQWHDDPLVKKGLVSALGNQSDPGVQIKMINMLVQMKEKSAVSEMQKLTQSEHTIEAVKSNAALGIARLL